MKIFVIGFPKAGTTSLEFAIKSAGVKTLHWAKYNIKENYMSHIKRSNAPASSVGMLIKMAKDDGLPLLHYMQGYDGFAQMDISLNKKLNYWPQLVDVPLLDKQYPDSKFIFNTRPLHKWISSINRWGNLRKRLTHLDIPGLPVGVGNKDSELVDWHDWHLNNMKNYFKDKNNLLIFDIENDDPSKLEKFIGKKVIWEQKNINYKKP